MALPESRHIDPRKFPEKVRKFVSPDAPPGMRMMLARGLVPMKPLVQLCALHQLAHGDDTEVAETASASVRKVPHATVLQIAAQPMLPVVLDWLTEVYADDRDVVRTVLLNRMTDMDTLVRVAKIANEETCEVIARNQQRLIESSDLVHALYMNRNTRASTADRVIDFAARNGLDLSSIPGYRDIIAAVEGEDLSSRTAEEDARIDETFRTVTEAFADEDEDEDEIHAPERAHRREEDQEEEQGGTKKSAAGRIRTMNIAQKLRLANLGTASERAVLINDSNKIIARAVIRSPALSNNEVFKYAGNKTLDEEIIGFIARQRKWTRHYRLKVKLVNNPKTPLQVAMNFLSHLRLSDLRMVSRSKGVSPQVGKAAKELMKKRMK